MYDVFRNKLIKFYSSEGNIHFYTELISIRNSINNERVCINDKYIRLKSDILITTKDKILSVFGKLDTKYWSYQFWNSFIITIIKPFQNFSKNSIKHKIKQIISCFGFYTGCYIELHLYQYNYKYVYFNHIMTKLILGLRQREFIVLNLLKKVGFKIIYISEHIIFLKIPNWRLDISHLYCIIREYIKYVNLNEKLILNLSSLNSNYSNCNLKLDSNLVLVSKYMYVGKNLCNLGFYEQKTNVFVTYSLIKKFNIINPVKVFNTSYYMRPYIFLSLFRKWHVLKRCMYEIDTVHNSLLEKINLCILFQFYDKLYGILDIACYIVGANFIYFKKRPNLFCILSSISGNELGIFWKYKNNLYQIQMLEIDLNFFFKKCYLSHFKICYDRYNSIICVDNYFLERFLNRFVRIYCSSFKIIIRFKKKYQYCVMFYIQIRGHYYLVQIVQNLVLDLLKISSILWWKD